MFKYLEDHVWAQIVILVLTGVIFGWMFKYVEDHVWAQIVVLVLTGVIFGWMFAEAI